MGLLSIGGNVKVACHEFHGDNNMVLIWHLILTFHLNDLNSNLALNLLFSQFLWSYLVDVS